MKPEIYPNNPIHFRCAIPLENYSVLEVYSDGIIANITIPAGTMVWPLVSSIGGDHFVFDALRGVSTRSPWNLKNCTVAAIDTANIPELRDNKWVVCVFSPVNGIRGFQGFLMYKEYLSL